MAKLFYMVSDGVDVINNVVFNNVIDTFKMSFKEKSMTFEAVCHAKY